MVKVILGTLCRDRNSSTRQGRPIQKIVTLLASVFGSPVSHKLVSPTVLTKTVATVEMNSWRDIMRPAINTTWLYLYRYAEDPT